MAKRALEDDGGHIHGNFHNYYTFRPPSDRLEMFPDGYLAGLVRQSQLAAGLIRDGEEPLPPAILDIGCNEGDLTAGVYDLLVRDLSVQPLALGVDLDPELISRANSKFSDDPKYRGLTFRVHDVMQSGAADAEREGDAESGDDPIRSFLRAHNRQQFDVVFCFSTTMWIHLNHGDEGLERFLSLLSRLASALVLEPQDWPAYRRASQRARRRKLPELEQFGVIRHRSNIIEHIQNTLLSEGEGRQKFSRVEDLGKGAWKRPLHVYTRDKTLV